MNTLEAIKLRKSVRVYKEESVEIDKVETIVNAGNQAAQTNTARPLYINVITNKEMLKNVAQVGTQIMKNSGNPFLEKAATELKLGSCYTTAPTLAFMSPELKAQVSIPENASPICAVLVGYEKETTPHEKAPKANVITYL